MTKIEELRKHLPEDERNFKIVTSVGDKDELLKTIGPQLYEHEHLHFFLLYDPYDASINWSVLIPFFRNWGEVMINHMVSDTARAIYSGIKGTTQIFCGCVSVFQFPKFQTVQLDSLHQSY